VGNRYAEAVGTSGTLTGAALTAHLRAMRARPTTRLLLVLVVAGLACGDATAPACTGQVTLTTSTSRTPVFTWTPNCGVASLSMATPPSAGLVNFYWNITSADARIESGVRYGRVPAGAVEVEPARPLPSGVQIGVQVTNASHQTIGATVLIVP
jgi:hypothetical protein